MNTFKDESNAFINKNKINAYNSGELNGLTFAIKDNIDVANEFTGYGNPCWSKAHPKPVAHAICLEQLLSAGANCLGKTHTDELAFSLIGENSFYGAPLNPKAPNRVSGGSSSGSASAVAHKLVDFAIGTDTGGSVRVPASNSGLWGYRPSHGLISVGGVAALAPSFDTVGILSNSCEILEKVMQILLAKDKEKFTNISICFLTEVFQSCDSQILEIMQPIVSKISQFYKVQNLNLAEIIDVEVNCDWIFNQAKLLLSTEIWNTFGAWTEESKPKVSSGVTNSLNKAKSANRKEIQDTLYKTKRFAKKLNQHLQGNVICFPTTLDLAPRLDQITDEFLSHYYPRTMGVTLISGLSRTPEITIPIVNVNDVPIGLSFIAGYEQDMMLVNFCNELYKKIN